MPSLFIEVFTIAVALSLDAMVAVLCWSVVQKNVRAADVFKFAFAFGLFQGLMPLAGWLAGETISQWVSAWDHWVAFAILSYVAFNMAKEGFSSPEDEATSTQSQVSWTTLLTLAVATSLDALAIGCSFAMVDYPIVWPSALIACVCFVLTACAAYAGKALSDKAIGFTNRLSLVGATVLFAIGVKILYDHGALDFFLK